MRTPILQIDAFTDEPFRGNPAAVCLLDRGRDDGWMRSVALEMNLSETAFVGPLGAFGDAVDRTASAPCRHAFDLRWLTPAVEVALCGHADPVTGSAHCCLAPFWGARLGMTAMTGFQASARGGVVRVRVSGDRVQLGGQAVTVLEGELRG